ncbi:MAG: hypothetical protein JOY54_02215 [Acidobacteriaceae bacterium]|nr:hypothetical protein [Acidobacteriaceae bacterium]
MALAGFALAGACEPKKHTGFGGYALVAASGDNSITAIDLTTFQLAKSIPLSGSPTAVVPGPAGRSYVLTPVTGRVHILDADLNLAGSYRLADELSHMRLTQDGKRVIATAARSRELIEADPADLRVIRRHKLHAEPSFLDVSAGNVVAVSSGEQGMVELVDLASGRQTQLQLPAPVGDVRFRADGKLLLLANYGARSLTALSVPDLQTVADLPLAMQPQNLCFNADQGQLFVSGDGMDAVAIVFPYNTLEVDQTVLAGRDPGPMACSAAPAYLFVASANGSDVCILNIDTRKVIGIVEVGEKPSYICITPDSRYALVLDQKSEDLAVIYIPDIARNTLRTNRYKTGGSLFTLLPVGNRPVHVAITPKLA